jgi:hypothetical protein
LSGRIVPVGLASVKLVLGNVGNSSRIREERLQPRPADRCVRMRRPPPPGSSARSRRRWVMAASQTGGMAEIIPAEGISRGKDV